jgi:hypothetical protein
MIQDLTIEMMEDAKKLLRENYDQARRNLPILPSDIYFPPLAPLFKTDWAQRRMKTEKSISRPTPKAL